MRTARDRLRIVAAATAVLLLVACGTATPSVDESPPADGVDASAVGAGSRGCIGFALRAHPFAHEVRDWIAYQTDRGGARERSGCMHFDGTEDHEVALDVPGAHHHPDWFPDGTQLLLTSRTETDTLYVLDLETNAARPLWECSAPCIGDDEAAWSPDGSQIVFIRAMEPLVDGVPSCALMIGDPVSGEVEQVGPTRSCNDRETFPHWSDDGARITYYRAAFDGQTAIASAVYVFDLATAEETKVTDDALFGWRRGLAG